MISIPSNSSIPKYLTYSSITSFVPDVQQMIQKCQEHAGVAGVAKLIFKVKMVSWILPITQIFKITEGDITWEKRKVINSLFRHNIYKYDVDSKSQKEKINFNKEIKDINDFIKTSLAFGVVFYIKAVDYADKAIAHGFVTLARGRDIDNVISITNSID